MYRGNASRRSVLGGRKQAGVCMPNWKRSSYEGAILGGMRNATARSADVRLHRPLGSVQSLVSGALSFAILHLHFLITWRWFYVSSAFKGYEQATSRGFVHPWFSAGPRAILVTEVFFFVLCVGLCSLRLVNRPAGILLFCSGVLLSAFAFTLTNPDALHSNFLPFVVITYPFWLLPPMLLGFAVGSVIASIRRRLHRG